MCVSSLLKTWISALALTHPTNTYTCGVTIILMAFKINIYVFIYKYDTIKNNILLIYNKHHNGGT